VSSEIISRLNQQNFFFSSKIISLPDQPVPTSFYLTKKYYPSIEEIYKEILSFLNIKNKFKIKITKGLHDVPGEWFSGPF
jgi:pyruvate dehydrogenase E1 component beta subunit